MTTNGNIIRPEQFNLGASQGEQPIQFQVGHHDKRVAVKVQSAAGDITAFLMPAQARELAMSIMGIADIVEGQEGEAGQVRRDANVEIGAIQFSLPSGGIV